MPIGKLNGDVQRPRIMLAVDDPAVRRSLQMLLQSRGFDVRSHTSSATLLADPTLQQARCLISDERLGDGDGLQLLRILRGRDWLAPAILITRGVSSEVESAANAAGYDSVIEMPLYENVLALLVARLI